MGRFFHYLNSVQNNPDSPSSRGKCTGWDECVNRLGGVVSIDCALNHDGSLDPEQMNVLRGLSSLR